MPDGLPPLRPNVHSLYDHLLRACWRLDALDEWRAEEDRRVSVLESQVVTEKEARKLREALSQHGRLQLTRAQQVLIGLVAAGELVQLLRGFV